jgi:hypothetical protein
MNTCCLRVSEIQMRHLGCGLSCGGGVRLATVHQFSVYWLPRRVSKVGITYGTCWWCWCTTTFEPASLRSWCSIPISSRHHLLGGVVLSHRLLCQHRPGNSLWDSSRERVEGQREMYTIELRWHPICTRPRCQLKPPVVHYHTNIL